MKHNRFFAALISLVLVLSCLPLEARAETIATGTCGEKLIWELSDQGVLTISGSGDMYDYTTSSNPAPWMGKRDAITSVVVSSGVTSIGANTFYLCQNLKTVTIADGLLSIGAAAFDSCYGLTEISMPDSITKIGVNAFSACRSLEFLKLPAKLKRIPGFMCRDCRNLKVVVISKTTYEIGRDAFSWCNNLWHVLYTGSKSQWKRITIQGSVENSDYCLESATRHYKCDGTEVTDIKNKICSVCSGDCDHVWNDGVVKKEPTCTEDGQMRYTCGKCQETKSESISALGHEYTAEVTAPNCTEQGYTVYTCTRCQETMIQDYTAPTGHSWDNGTITKAQTCTESGEKTYTCADCGGIHTETANATGHAYGDWVQIKAPTYEENGMEEQECGNCGIKGQRMISKLEPLPTLPSHTEPVATTRAPQPSQPPVKPSEKDPNNTGMMMLIVAITACLGATAIVLIRKKKK